MKLRARPWAIRLAPPLIIHFVELVNFYNRAEENNERVPKRYIRDMQNPIDFYDDKEFFNRFRFSKTTVLQSLMPLVFNDIEAEFNDNSMRGLPIPPLLKLLAVLRYYRTGNFQIVTGDLVGISQPTISRCVKDISRIIASKLPTFVKFPATLEGKIHNQVLFSNIAGNFKIICSLCFK
ncbi:uncharacterized protein LOC132925817 [Rhopalosiphum padi]|uniref:uncharacterized protein LOC132925817 n=1 Tax=Rhopalosiphum padi TaxID=40932 RepID=UPI00298EA410|nr:uncharacterized protein LOC132925817 [Rhopalosiphum padi]